ncbi:hypothetical protein CEXT_505481 [Caerostris extrusa]|uniref:Uncharacterized protein n=1 Tax=Caerostris extrusa TaxID=172846 RepID=A0AAV4V1M6_CAEEX|nr:hypothetical protein CEXT_505481 [Caerostris extrusa]
MASRNAVTVNGTECLVMTQIHRTRQHKKEEEEEIVEGYQERLGQHLQGPSIHGLPIHWKKESRALKGASRDYSH